MTSSRTMINTILSELLRFEAFLCLVWDFFILVRIGRRATEPQRQRTNASGVVWPEGGDFGEIGIDALGVQPGEHLAVGSALGFHADEVFGIGQHQFVGGRNSGLRRRRLRLMRLHTSSGL